MIEKEHGRKGKFSDDRLRWGGAMFRSIYSIPQLKPPNEDYNLGLGFRSVRPADH